MCWRIVCKNNLTKHGFTHAGEKPFKYKFCDRGFSEIENLTRHEHTHTGEKPFKCRFCDQGLSQNGNLTQHERKHTGSHSGVNFVTMDFLEMNT